MSQRFKSFGAQVKVIDEAQGIVEAVVSVFGVKDSYDEVMEPGCFTKSLEAKSPVICWMHDWRQPIGKTIEAVELPAGDSRLPESIRAFGGLYVKGQLTLETQAGREAFAYIKQGVLTEYSVGYFEKGARDETENGERIRRVTEVDLVEWSPVIRGANPVTTTISAKADRGLTFNQHSEQLLGQLREYMARAQDLTAKRAENGQRPSAERVAEFREIHTELGALLTELEQSPEWEIAEAQAKAALALVR